MSFHEIDIKLLVKTIEEGLEGFISYDEEAMRMMYEDFGLQAVKDHQKQYNNTITFCNNFRSKDDQLDLITDEELQKWIIE